MRAVITVVGKDTVGIWAKVSTKCSEHGVNVAEVTQSVLQDVFAMIMIVDITGINIPFGDFVDRMGELGKKQNLEIHTMHEDIFNSMHTI